MSNQLKKYFATKYNHSLNNIIKFSIYHLLTISNNDLSEDELFTKFKELLSNDIPDDGTISIEFRKVLKKLESNKMIDVKLNGHENLKLFKCLSISGDVVNRLKDEVYKYKLSDSYATHQRKMDEANIKRKEFCERFSVSKLPSLRIDDYVLGVQNKSSFSYMLERESLLQGGYGSIRGGTSDRFGIYFGRTKTNRAHEYRISNRYNRGTLDESFKFLKRNLISLINAINNNDILELQFNMFSDGIKFKTAMLFKPCEHMSIYSSEHLNNILDLFDMSLIKNYSVFTKNIAILKLKTLVDPKLENVHFSDFLYSNDLYCAAIYGRDKISDIFINQTITKIEFNDLFNKKRNPSPQNRINEQIDSDQINLKKTKQGAIAEELVFEYEKNRLSNEYPGFPQRVSLTDSSLGYDIHSKNSDGTEKYIEVKSKVSGGPTNVDFFITKNEYEKLKANPSNYSIYFVYSLSENPKFFEIKFSHIKDLEKEVVAYRFFLTTVPPTS